MILDIIGITILAATFIQGFRKGVIVAIFSLLAVVIGIVCALKLSQKLAGYLFAAGWVTSAWAQLVSYLLLFIGVAWMVRLGGRFLQQSFEAVLLGLPNRIVGGLLYAFVGAFVWSSCLWLGNQAHMIEPETLAASKTYDYFVGIAPWAFRHIGTVLPFAKSVFTDLQHFFDGVNQHLPDHVGTH